MACDKFVIVDFGGPVATINCTVEGEHVNHRVSITWAEREKTDPLEHKNVFEQ